MKQRILIIMLFVGFIFPALAEASPANPSFFESLFEWVGDALTFGEVPNVERHVKKAEEIFKDLEELKESGADKELLVEGALRYARRAEKAKEHLDRAVAGKLKIPIAAKIFFATSTKQTEVLSTISLALLEETEDLQEEAANLLQSLDKELESLNENFDDFLIADSAEPRACTEVHEPVCGVDGKTYTNSCVAKEKNVEIAEAGECKQEEKSSTKSETKSTVKPEVKTEHVKPAAKSEVKIEPVKQEIPKTEPIKISCISEYAPICGVDGKTYENECRIKESNVAVAHWGVCPPPKPPEPVDTSDPDSPHDLSVKVVSHYGSALLKGDIINFSGVVLNSGKENIESETRARLFIDKGNDGVYELMMAEYPVSPLKAGGEETVIWKGALVLEVGTHTVKICADTQNNVKESDEKNNCALVTFTVKEKVLLPDLIIQALPTFEPLSPKAGESMSFFAVVKNRGEGNSASVSAMLSIDFGNDKTTDTTFASKRTNAISSRASENVSWGGVWVAISGVHRAEFCADANLEVYEQDESNNCSSVIFEVVTP